MNLKVSDGISERSKAKKNHERSKVEQKRRTGLLCEALSGDNVRSVKQAILFERSELNRL
ncbi:hypothetical protein [Bacteroides ihuae]|uniref:hypothetical protein n=1 Tax=Bacteroides ihuae TaxID=1852362 RepID=UPI0011147104|nr:hypothetical protein [Bacteroides ihuae]